MFVRCKKQQNGRTIAVQVVESKRLRDGRVQQRIVRHVGNVAANDADRLAILKREAERLSKTLPLEARSPLFTVDDDALDTLEVPDPAPDETPVFGVDAARLRLLTSPVAGVHHVYGDIYRQLGLHRVLPRARFRMAHRVLFQTVMARLARPVSKLALTRTMQDEFALEVNVNEIYATMDHLDERRIERLKKMAAKLALGLAPAPLTVMFYDCTTLYFESVKSDELRQKGYSKDGKSNQTQVLLALMVTPEGLPVGYELLPGATYEGSSLLPALASLRKRHPVARACVVADSGMLSRKNLEGLRAAGIHYIVGARLRSMAAKDVEWLDQADRETVIDRPHGSGERLIVDWREERAAKSAGDRERLLEQLARKLAKGAKGMVGNKRQRSYLKQVGDADWVIDPQRIAAAERFDGWHGVVTDLDDDIAGADVLSQYRGLWQVEDAFRVAKNDLRIRPIFHWTERRIHAHVAIVFMTLMCVRHLQLRLRMRGQPMSERQIHDALMEVRAIVMETEDGKRRFVYPPRLSRTTRTLYSVVQRQPTSTPRELT